MSAVSAAVCPVCASPGEISFVKSGVPYAVCPGCACCYAAAPIPESVRATSNDNGASRNSRETNLEVLRRIEAMRAPRAVLDFGCGNGELSALINAEKPYRAIPVDRDTPVRLEDVAAGSVDVVIMREVVEHIARPLPLFRRFAEVLAPGGFVYLESSFTDHLGDPARSGYVDPRIDHCLVHSAGSLELTAWMAGFGARWLNRNVAFLERRERRGGA